MSNDDTEVDDIATHIERDSLPFTQIPNALLEDISLCEKTRFFYCIIASQKENWVFYQGQMCKKYGLSYHAYYDCLKALEARGWIQRKQQIGDGGKFGGLKIIVKNQLGNEPTAKKPQTVKRQTDESAQTQQLGNEPSYNSPKAVNRQTNNTNINNTNHTDASDEAAANLVLESEQKPKKRKAANVLKAVPAPRQQYDPEYDKLRAVFQSSGKPKIGYDFWRRLQIEMKETPDVTYNAALAYCRNKKDFQQNAAKWIEQRYLKLKYPTATRQSVFDSRTANRDADRSAMQTIASFMPIQKKIENKSLDNSNKCVDNL